MKFIPTEGDLVSRRRSTSTTTTTTTNTTTTMIAEDAQPRSFNVTNVSSDDIEGVEFESDGSSEEAEPEEEEEEEEQVITEVVTLVVPVAEKQQQQRVDESGKMSSLIEGFMHLNKSRPEIDRNETTDSSGINAFVEDSNEQQFKASVYSQEGPYKEMKGENSSSSSSFDFHMFFSPKLLESYRNRNGADCGRCLSSSLSCYLYLCLLILLGLCVF